MGFGLSTKREFMPDGSPFEGVGIAPDIEVPIPVDDLATGRDSVLEKALSLAQAAGADSKRLPERLDKRITR